MNPRKASKSRKTNETDIRVTLNIDGTGQHRIATGIDGMQRTGRLVKLPVIGCQELEIVASGFNRLGEQVEEQKRRLREHIVELQRVNAEFDQLAHLKDDFLMTINHQLRTPLTALTESIELLRDGSVGPLRGEQQGLVAVMDKNAQQLSALIAGILELSLLKSGRRPLHRQPADLAALLRQSQGNWQASAPGYAIRLVCDELPPVYMDPPAIQEVVDHVLHNALRHAPERSEILV